MQFQQEVIKNQYYWHKYIWWQMQIKRCMQGKEGSKQASKQGSTNITIIVVSISSQTHNKIAAHQVIVIVVPFFTGQRKKVSRFCSMETQTQSQIFICPLVRNQEVKLEQLALYIQLIALPQNYQTLSRSKFCRKQDQVSKESNYTLKIIKIRSIIS